ncbi:hypothetical protein V6N11_018694 [Hibiscus sabdariffa]|uniref:Uncharacterized protein n=1 Tax=Hibiscus sabdariffa TaxID=183260 RepID=A0ABR2QSZ8_9ROSI
MLRGVASTTSILRMYTALVQPFFSAWYLSLGLVGTAALLYSANIRQGKARMPLSFAQAAASSLARISPTFMRHDVPLHKRVPKLGIRPKTGTANRMRISARRIPGSACLTKEVLDLLKVFIF